MTSEWLGNLRRTLGAVQPLGIGGAVDPSGLAFALDADARWMVSDSAVGLQCTLVVGDGWE